MNVTLRRAACLVSAGLLALPAACATPPAAMPPVAIAPSAMSTVAGDTTTHPICTPPALPPPGSTNGGMTGLVGPAVTSLTGGAATAGFRIDAGNVTVSVPRAGDHPSISANIAECEALASTDRDSSGFGDFALDYGLVEGYARVTVADGLPTAPSMQWSDGTVAPRLPRLEAFHDRLVWIVVVYHPEVAFCPMMRVNPHPSPTPTGSATPSTDYGYQMFLLDATDGDAALAYTEGGPALCGGIGRMAPMVGVPTDEVSVPWKLTHRDHGGYSAKATAEMHTCDGYDTINQPDEDTPHTLAVMVEHPIGPSCGGSATRTIAVHADIVTDSLPATIVHAPTGLSIPQPYVDRSASSSRQPTQISASACGTHVSITVGSVLVMPEIDNPPGIAYPVKSSDPSVLGPLAGAPTGPVAELRAWKAGSATLTITSANMDAGHGCASPWALHVTVS